jgi:hypothetical protein
VTGAEAIKERRALMKADGAATKPVVAMALSEQRQVACAWRSAPRPKRGR